MSRRSLLLALALLLSGCQAALYGTAASFSRLELGMSRAEVIDILGRPVAVHVDGDAQEEYLIYKRMKHAISSWPRTYQVTLREGRVVSWGEQYDERNLNVY